MYSEQLLDMKITLLPIVWSLMLSMPLWAQNASFDESYQKAREKNPEGLQFTLDLGGKTQFQRGEIIPIRLNFSSASPLNFKLEARNYDRAGRLNYTDFFITDRPQDTTDPLRDHFKEGVISFGGLSSIPQVIGPKTQTINLTLNEYLRFDKPGHYRLYVLSMRLFPSEKQSGSLFGGVPVASKIIEFDITAGDEWAQKRAHEIEAIVQASSDKTEPLRYSQDENRYNQLARELRFLDVPLSRRLMIANFDTPKFRYDGDFYFGLIGTRDKSDVISALREHLQNPDGAVSARLLQILTALLFSQSDAPALPRYPNKAAPDSPEMQQYYAVAKVRAQKRSEIEGSLLNDLNRALPAKRSMARAITLTTAIESLATAKKLTYGANDLSGEPALPNLRGQLIASWNDLPRDTQNSLLQSRWPLIRDAALMPLLVTATEAAERRNPHQTDNYEERQWRSLLLARLHQLSLVTGGHYLQVEMQRPEPRVDSGVLLDLPNLTPFDLEKIWLQNLRGHAKNHCDTERVAQLVARYASPRIAAPLKAWFDQNSTIGFETRTALLAYFARVWPDGISAMLDADIAENKQPIFEAIGAFTMNEGVEAAAIKYLQSANRYLAADAARALSAYGSAKVEAVLWTRLGKLHAGLQGKKLDNQLIEFETVLAHSLALMPGVQTKRAKLEKVRDLCWSTQARQRLSSISLPHNGYGISEIRYHPTLFNHYTWSFGRNRNGYWSLSSLTSKLRQFPRGTTFSFHIEGIEAAPDVKTVTARLELWLKSHGYALKIASGFA